MSARRSAFRSIAIVALLLGLWPAAMQPLAAEEVKSPLVGVWKITSFTRAEVGVDAVAKPYGEHPRGYRVYTAGGRSFYMFFAEDRKAVAGPVTDADRIAWFNTMASAGGTFKVDGDQVVFYPEVSAVEYLLPITNHFQISGRELSLTSTPIKNVAGKPDLVFRSTYERVE